MLISLSAVLIKMTLDAGTMIFKLWHVQEGARAFVDNANATVVIIQKSRSTDNFANATTSPATDSTDKSVQDLIMDLANVEDAFAIQDGKGQPVSAAPSLTLASLLMGSMWGKSVLIEVIVNVENANVTNPTQDHFVRTARYF